MQNIHYTEQLVRLAIRRAIPRLLGRWYFAALLLLAISVGLGLYRKDYDWFLGVISTTLFFGILFPLAAIRANTRAALARFRGLENGVASIEISEGRLRGSSHLGAVDIPLSRVTQVWRYPEYWTLLSGRSILLSIPTQGVPATVTEAWLDELRAVGAEISPSAPTPTT